MLLERVPGEGITQNYHEIQGLAHGNHVPGMVDHQSQERWDHHALWNKQARSSPRWLGKGRGMSLTLQEEGALHSSGTTCGGGIQVSFRGA